MAEAASVKTPVLADLKTSLEDLVDEAIKLYETRKCDPKLLAKYRAIVGCILYATTTVRADAAFAAGVLSRAMNKPTPALYDAAVRVVQYLYNTRALGIHYSRNTEFDLKAFSDSSWRVRCSTSGYALFMANAVVSYLSKIQPTIAMSTAQSEINACSIAALEATFLTSMSAQITGEDLSPVDLFVDSKAAVDQSHDYISNSRVRHVERRQLKIRELVERALVTVKSIGTDENVADIFTKALGWRQFDKHRKTLLNLPMSG